MFLESKRLWTKKEFPWSEKSLTSTRTSVVWFIGEVSSTWVKRSSKKSSQLRNGYIVDSWDTLYNSKPSSKLLILRRSCSKAVMFLTASMKLVSFFLFNLFNKFAIEIIASKSFSVLVSAASFAPVILKRKKINRSSEILE